MNRETLKIKLAEDIPEEMCDDFFPMEREQIAEHFISQFLLREGYKTIEMCFKNYAYLVTSMVLSWRAQGVGNHMSMN